MALSIGWLKGFLRNRLPMCNSALVLLFVITVTNLRIGAAWGNAAYKVVGRVTDPALTWGGLSAWIKFEDMHTAHVFATLCNFLFILSREGSRQLSSALRARRQLVQ